MNHDDGSAKRLADLLPQHGSADEVLERIAQHWTYWRGLPIPTWNLTCSTCAGTDVFVKDWSFHKKSASSGSANPWRCDVRTKCGSCSLVQIYGVMLPPPGPGDDYLGRTTQRTVRWRDVEAKLREDVEEG